MILGPDLSHFAHSMVNMGTSLCGNLGRGVFVNDFVWVNGGWVKGSRNREMGQQISLCLPRHSGTFPV